MELRKICTFVDTAYSDAGRKTQVPLRKVAVAAVIKNPYVGRYADDLSILINASPHLGVRLATIALEELGELGVQSYGKAAIVGLRGEQEHGVACLTTVFGDALRATIGGGKAWISSMTKRAAPDTTLDIPLAHKDALYVRSHYDGMSITIHDAPLDDEIVVVCCLASGPRLNQRVGGLSAAEIMGVDGLR